MIEIKEQEELFTAIGNLLERKMVIYSIGGTAMMLRGIKNATKGIDLVFDEEKDRSEFILALKKIKAKESDAKLVYNRKESTPIMFTLEDTRFDLFTNKIITSTFSAKMKERARQSDEFGHLLIKSADPHDIIIMKSVTSRDKDLDDIVSINNKIKLNWDEIINEAHEQVRLGNESAVLSLGEKLEKLNNQKRMVVPAFVLDKLWEMLNEQINEKAKNNK